ncbi:acyltransferase family protein [Sphingomonas mollis]|uniref:DUF1624 domain-containing protein n=1 Tax=Sphingomonas mollis TaxID=2795726 RepID=A0ABS0XM34_9SPHN|nr:heparan-alpha-glucosaminide N-acetyltransferase domain-containing protein [Sphingomonas sp. BT553]MBJ6121082.1 DUF1624 domain-containing protein [Sphingomonas sp. BT553]
MNRTVSDTAPLPAPLAPRERFLSLDVFRGLTILLMIVVNTAGPGAESYRQLKHAPWFGFTLADLVFPSFLFAVGTAMSFSLRRDAPAGPFLRQVARRGALMFLLGFLMYWYPFVAAAPDGGWAIKPLADTRIPGVLQRIALCYVAAAIAIRWLDVRGLVLLSAALLIGYWLVLTGLSGPGLAYDKMGNAGTRLDLWLIGPRHLYRRDHGFDPEGLLGTMPAIVNVLGGYLAGRFVRLRGKTRRTVAGLALAGAGLVALSALWARWMPIAKKLWTGSYVLLTIGLALIALAALVEMVERRGWRRGTRIFTIPGRNPLAIYLFSELFVMTLALIPVGPDMHVYEWVGIAMFQQIAPGPAGSLMCAVAYTALCWLFAWMLDRRGLILRV